LQDTDGREFMAAKLPAFEDLLGGRRGLVRMARRLRPAEEASHVVSQVQHTASLVADATGPVAVTTAIRQESQQLYNGRTTVVRHVTNAWWSDPFSPLMERSRQALAAAGCQVRPGKWHLGRLGMGTAGSLLVTELEVPTIGYGPGSEDMAHACGEHVHIPTLLESVYGTAAIVHSLIGVPVCGWTSDEI
jgi:acetylornithine deacetylase/succinyl-diaminopimelate desuccinylase-like protein